MDKKRGTDNYEFHGGLKFIFENGMFAIGIAFWDNSGNPPWLLGFTNMKTEEQLKRLLPKSIKLSKERKTTRR